LEAQDVILQAIEGQVGGTAEANVSSFDKINLAVERVKDQIGDALLPAIERMVPYLETLADVAIKVFEAFAESGITGGIQAFKAEMNTLQFQGSPMFNFFKQMYDAIAKTYNALQTLKDGIKLIAIAHPSQWGRVLGDIAQGRNPFGGMGNRMPTWDEFLATGPQVAPSAGQFRMRESGSGVTINVNGGDPQAVVDALRRYSRQNGGISGVRLS
jgi:hypothetical protein